ncbi:deoxyribose-phosphate aldolase [Christiangramia sabulilitoris]|uniref:Deoxyribose-phosphate aldolase n=1 Tax=Christiangramia sabulilitoris TaxID=2583991 RepID=A0A550I805_9FLAO|nr:deoxyribose-phosphate aldolase [Christiangramia sabulilitoris]TRO67105.1 deoxyribose-phosphate aldolase [Christiangramia sabulilitoris]
MELKNYIDHTLLAANATEEQIERLCREAKTYGFYAVCVNSSYVPHAKASLKDSRVKLAATIGFPLGATSTEAKVFEARLAAKEGADEIDMVINIGFLLDGKLKSVKEEIAAVKKAIDGRILKVIIETCYLTSDEILTASKLVAEAGADFVKTSTGFGSRGASTNDVKIMKQAIGDKIKIKASGGIRDAETAREYISLGADRIGTSSGIKIIS